MVRAEVVALKVEAHPILPGASKSPKQKRSQVSRIPGSEPNEVDIASVATLVGYQGMHPQAAAERHELCLGHAGDAAQEGQLEAVCDSAVLATHRNPEPLRPVAAQIPSAPRWRVIRSEVDDSVNWIAEDQPGAIEARYVRRAEDYVAVYLSSQTGCRMACRMCHLTATGQTNTRDVRLGEFLHQADAVLDHLDGALHAGTIHYNFMARGEPLESGVLLRNNGELFDALWGRARGRGMRARFLVSTILPRSLRRPLVEIFERDLPEIYYSLYTVRDDVRRRWLPKAMPAREGLALLAAWQRQSYKIVKLHFPFIEGVNDSEADVHALCNEVRRHELRTHVNVVRYNPASSGHGRESSPAVLERNLALLRQRLPGARIKLIPRVGEDVYASCGMFAGAANPS